MFQQSLFQQSLFQQSLFQQSVLNVHLARQDQKKLDELYAKFQKHFGDPEIQENYRKSWDSIRQNLPLKILSDSITTEEDITKKLYTDYSTFKTALWKNLCEKNPQFDRLTLFKKTQKLLDRFLFIFFAEDRGLLRPNEIERIVSEWKKLQKLRVSQLLYDRFKQYFGYLNTGDPACGSGAFLNQAFDFLIGEHFSIDELHKHVEFGKGNAFTFADVETAILENNLYGVDINEESVEIAKLSLWLRSAAKGRKLNDLSNRIKLGNSLIDDPAIAGEKAFNWQKEFPEVFDRQLPASQLPASQLSASRRCKSAVGEPGTYVPGSLTDTAGFDVVIGNPPYVQLQSVGDVSEQLSKCNYVTYEMA